VRRSNRSARLSSALAKVPATKPACTLLVSNAVWNGVKAQSRWIAASEAVVANHTDIAATSLSSNSASETVLPP